MHARRIPANNPQKLIWVNEANGRKPNFAIPGGVDNGEILYVARGKIGNEWIPGKFHPSHRVCYVPYGGKEVAKLEYQILTLRTTPFTGLSWVKTSGATIPENAFRGGKDPSGECMYIGRALHCGSLVVGKVARSHRKCYISYGGVELGFDNYEILVVDDMGKLLGCNLE